MADGSGKKVVQRVQFTNQTRCRACLAAPEVNWTLVPGLHNNGGPCRLHPKVANRNVGVVPNQIVKTIDLKLDKYNLPGYPPLPVNLDSKKIECLKI